MVKEMENGEDMYQESNQGQQEKQTERWQQGKWNLGQLSCLIALCYFFVNEVYSGIFACLRE